jgi:cystathionine beta-lyase/cystathionine gamma-synthase
MNHRDSAPVGTGPSDLSWILNHLGEDRESYFNAVAPPIIQSSIFAWPTVDAMRQGFGDELTSHMYTRGNNPTVEILRRKVAALEGAEDCLMFGSGAGAISAAVIGSLKGGDHAVCVARPYSWTRTVLQDLLGRFGVATTFVDGTDVANFENALTDATRLIVLESPNSMTFEQQDLAAVAKLAKSRGIRTICDNSYATPLNQSPIALGIDLVAHSATKYLNGHSDVVAGALCGRHDVIYDIFRGPFMTLGALLAPNDAWLMIRGLRTLPIRMQRIAETTSKVLAFVEAHPKVRRVHSPRASANPQLALTKKQLRGASGLLTLELDAPDVASVERFCNALKRFLMTVSWGGYESLLFPVAAAHPAGTPLEVPGGVSQNFVRLSIGLEESDVLIRDLDTAFARL